jgi:hypothetical protein
LKDVTGGSSRHMDLTSKEGSSSSFHEVPPEKNRGFFQCHLQGISHITCWNIGLSSPDPCAPYPVILSTPHICPLDIF